VPAQSVSRNDESAVFDQALLGALGVPRLDYALLSLRVLHVHPHLGVGLDHFRTLGPPQPTAAFWTLRHDKEPHWGAAVLEELFRSPRKS